MHYYLARWRGTGSEEDPYRMPFDGVWSVVDLRPDPTNIAGLALAAVEVRQDGPSSRYLGDDLDALWTTARRRAVEGDLGVTLRDATIRKVLAELLVEHGDDQRGDRWNRLKAGGDGRLRIYLGGEEIWQMAEVRGGAIVTDNFDRANSTNLGANWTEVTGDSQISSNVLAGQVDTICTVRYESDLVGADHYTQLKGVSYVITGSQFKIVGPSCRFSSSEDTAYSLRRSFNSATTLTLATLALFKRVAGVNTALTSDLVDPATSGEVLKLEVSGSTLTGYRDGVLKNTVTDTSITGHLRTGIYLLAGSSGLRVRADDFEAADLGAAAQTVSPSSITTEEAFGTPTLTPGGVVLSPSGIASEETFGTAILTPGGVVLTPSSIDSAEAMGTPSLTLGAVTISPAAIGSVETFGAPVVSTGGVSIAPAGIGSEEVLGVPVFGVLVSPAGITSSETFGLPVLTPGPVTLAIPGVGSAEAFGNPSVATPALLLPSGILSSETFGLPAFTLGGSDLEAAISILAGVTVSLEPTITVSLDPPYHLELTDV